MRMGIAVLVALQALILLFHPTPASADFLTPLISPFRNGSCDGVQCGKGTCKVSSGPTLFGLAGFSCECEAGWTRIFKSDTFQFLPCLVPNCSFSYSCSREAPVPAPEPRLPSNLTDINPCSLTMCGGGNCVKTANFSYRCDCNPGYDNLLNNTNFPCFQDCSLGADCARLGIGLSSPLGPPPPNLAASGPTPSRGNSPPIMSGNGPIPSSGNSPNMSGNGPTPSRGIFHAPGNLLLLLFIQVVFLVIIV